MLLKITSDSVNLSHKKQVTAQSATGHIVQNFGENLRYGETISLTTTYIPSTYYTRDIQITHCEIHLCNSFFIVEIYCT